MCKREREREGEGEGEGVGEGGREGGREGVRDTVLDNLTRDYDQCYVYPKQDDSEECSSRSTVHQLRIDITIRLHFGIPTLCRCTNWLAIQRSKSNLCAQ